MPKRPPSSGSGVGGGRRPRGGVPGRSNSSNNNDGGGGARALGHKLVFAKGASAKVTLPQGVVFDAPAGSTITVATRALTLPGVRMATAGLATLLAGDHVLWEEGRLAPPPGQTIALPLVGVVPAVSLPAGTLVRLALDKEPAGGMLETQVTLHKPWAVWSGCLRVPESGNLAVPAGGRVLVGAEGTKFSVEVVLAEATSLPAAAEWPGGRHEAGTVLPANFAVPKDSLVPGGTTIPGPASLPAGTVLPEGSLLPEGTVVPVGTTVAVGSAFPTSVGSIRVLPGGTAVGPPKGKDKVKDEAKREDTVLPDLLIKKEE